MGRPPTNLPRVTFRFPEELRTQLEEAAHANNRSVNAEVVARLERTFSGESLLSADMQKSFEELLREGIAKATETIIASGKVEVDLKLESKGKKG